MIGGIVIEESARNSLISETQKFKVTETGGVLCGIYKDDFIIIKSISGPGPDAYHSVDEFIMDKNYMDEFLDKEYAESKSMNIYVGEWHTHPQVFPEASPQDWQSIGERTLEWGHGDIVFIIIGFLGFDADKLEDQIIALTYDKEEGILWKIPIIFS